MTRHEPVVLSRAKSATFISVILQNNKNTVQLHFGCTVFFEFTDNAVQFCSSTALPNKRAAMHCTISLSLASSGHSKTRGLRHLKNSSTFEGLCQSPRGPFHRLRRVWLPRAASIPVHSKSLILPDPARQPRCTFRAEAVGWVVNLSVMPL